MNKPPFKMRTVTAMEHYRADTWDTKEPETIEWIRAFDPHDVFFDVGANVGVYSLWCAYLFPEMLITAFEPMPENYKALCANVELNNFGLKGFEKTRRGIDHLPWAVGSRNGFAALNYCSAEAGKSGAQACQYSLGSPGEVKLIQIATIDSFKETNPSHVKIDIDGQELEVVKGMAKTLPRIKSILIEVSKASKQEVMKILTFSGFTTYNIFNVMTPHSRERRAKEGIDAENIVFTR